MCVSMTERVWAQAPVRGSKLSVLARIAWYTDSETGEAWPLVEEIAAGVNLRVRRTQDILRELQALGLIEVKVKRGRGLRNSYRILLPEEGEKVQLPAPITEGKGARTCTFSTSEKVQVLAEKVQLSVSPYKEVERQIKTCISDSSPSPKSSRPKAEPDPRVVELFAHYKARVQPAARVYDPAKIAARLKRFTFEELVKGIDNFAADPWWMENNSARGADWFFHSDKRSEQFLNMKPRPAAAVQSPARPALAGRGRHV